MMNYSNVMPQRKFGITIPESTRDQIIALARDAPGLLQKDIAEITGVSVPSVSAVLRQAGAKEAERWRQQITDYLEDNPDATNIQIAESFNLLLSTIRHIRGQSPIGPRGPSAIIETGAISPLLRDTIIEWATAFPDATYREITEIIEEELGRSVHNSTVFQVLKSAGMELPPPSWDIARSKFFESLAERNQVIRETLRAHPLMTYEEAGEEFGLSGTQISIIARAAGITRPGGVKVGTKFQPHPRSPEITARNQMIAEYIRAHPQMTWEEVGNEFGLRPTSISRIAKESGLFRTGGKRLGYQHPPRPELIARNQEIADFLRAHPLMIYEEVAEEFGLGQGQIRRIAGEAGITRSPGRRRQSPQPYRNPQPRWNLARHRWE